MPIANRQKEGSLKTVVNILNQTERTKRRKLKSGESNRSTVNYKNEDIKRISKHLGRVSDFRHIADTTRLCGSKSPLEEHHKSLNLSSISFRFRQSG